MELMHLFLLIFGMALFEGFITFTLQFLMSLLQGKKVRFIHHNLLIFLVSGQSERRGVLVSTYIS